MPCGKCVQNGAFVAKFGYLWRNLGVFVAKKRKIKDFVGVFPYFWSLKTE
jgi:hypothetical protein